MVRCPICIMNDSIKEFKMTKKYFNFVMNKQRKKIFIQILMIMNKSKFV